MNKINKKSEKKFGIWSEIAEVFHSVVIQVSTND